MRDEKFKEEIGIPVMSYVKEALELPRNIVDSSENCVYITILPHIVSGITDRRDKIMNFIELKQEHWEDRYMAYIQLRECMPLGMGVKTNFNARASGNDTIRLTYSSYDKFTVLEAKRIQLALTVLTILALGIEDA